MERPWTKFPIEDCGEALESIPLSIKRIEPHPYVSLGAPYERGMDPWRLRKGLIPLLIEAEMNLQLDFPSLRLAVFDAWRPIAVQSFMVEHSINQECQRRGISRYNRDQLQKVDNIVNEVSMFWATPSSDPLTPPPHSTGAAIDLTLSSIDGQLLDMGGAIDQIGLISTPDFYANKEYAKAHLWNSRRILLSKIMINVGFVQHPNEWWHFSYGDQLWAWRSNLSIAIYGGIDFLNK